MTKFIDSGVLTYGKHILYHWWYHCYVIHPKRGSCVSDIRNVLFLEIISYIMQIHYSQSRKHSDTDITRNKKSNQQHPKKAALLLQQERTNADGNCHLRFHWESSSIPPFSYRISQCLNEAKNNKQQQLKLFDSTRVRIPNT